MERTHCAPKNQLIRRAHGSSAHAYLRQSGSCKEMRNEEVEKDTAGDMAGDTVSMLEEVSL